MKKPRPSLLCLLPLVLLAGCVRILNGASCPCVSGWVCCEAQNICRPEGSTCAEEWDDDERGVVDGGASASCPSDSSCAQSEAGSSEAESSEEASCDARPGPDALVCPGGPFEFAQRRTQKATVQALFGRWQLCEGTGFRWGPAAARHGIEFTSANQFFLLGVDADGALRRMAGVHASGSYEVRTPGPELPQSYVDVLFTFPEGGFAQFAPSFDDLETHMLAGGDSGFDSGYVRVAPGADNVPGVEIGAGPEMCTQQDAGVDAGPFCDGQAAQLQLCPGGPFSFARLASQKATRAALVGRWQVCEGTGFRWGPAEARHGIEFTSDGEFFLLGVDARGALRRTVGLRATGSYELSTVPDDQNVLFEFPEGGAASFLPSFDATKSHLHAGGDSGFDSNYVRVPDGAESVPGVLAPGSCN